MLQRYLVPYATLLDEQNYRVVFRDRIEHEANLEFAESGALAVPWLEDVYRAAFRSKVQSVRFSLPPSARVLDACSGFGYLGRFIADEFRATVVFCDLSQRQLAELRERLPNTLSRTAVAADVTQLPYPAGTFDAVVGNSFLHHLPDVPSALAEFRRVLKAGGVLLLLHEPGPNANFWESFPLSLLKDTSPMTGFTDLWMFDAADLERLTVQAAFAQVTVHGTGGLSAIALNWLLILSLKLNWQRRVPLLGVYLLRTWLNHLESRLPQSLKPWSPPSLMLYARKDVT